MCKRLSRKAREKAGTAGCPVSGTNTESESRYELKSRYSRISSLTIKLSLLSWGGEETVSSRTAL